MRGAAGRVVVPRDPSRPSGREMAFWYAAATVTYISASIVEKGLLNWFIGPLWLVGFVWAGPALTARIRRRPQP